MQRVAGPDAAFATKLDDDAKLIEQATKATIVLPLRKAFTSEVADDAQPPHEGANDDTKTARERLAKLNGALKEIESKRQAQSIDQTFAAKYADRQVERQPTPAPAKNLALLATRYVDTLSKETHEAIDDLRIPKSEGMDVGHAQARIELERNRLVDKYFPPPRTSVVVNINGRFIQAPPACIPYVYDPCRQFPQLKVAYRKVPIRPPGWADLKVIKTTLLKYDKGEIAHIENVLKGEIKVHEFNVTRRTEDTVTTDDETTTEDQKELQSTDRFEMEREVSSQLKEDMKFDTGMKMLASMGPVQLDTHLDFAYNTYEGGEQQDIH